MKIVPNPEWDQAEFEDTYLDGDMRPIPLTEDQKAELFILGKYVRYKKEGDTFVEVYPFIKVP